MTNILSLQVLLVGAAAPSIPARRTAAPPEVLLPAPPPPGRLTGLATAPSTPPARRDPPGPPLAGLE